MDYMEEKDRIEWSRMSGVSEMVERLWDWDFCNFLFLDEVRKVIFANVLLLIRVHY